MSQAPNVVGTFGRTAYVLCARSNFETQSFRSESVDPSAEVLAESSLRQAPRQIRESLEGDLQLRVPVPGDFAFIRIERDTVV